MMGIKRSKILPLAILFFPLLLLSSSALLSLAIEDPELKTCQHQCKQQRLYTEEQKNECLKECEEYHKMKKERESGREERESHGKEQEEENPFVFEEQHFETKVQTEQGRVWVLQKFTERSNLLNGIENFRLSILEAEPKTFVSPCHFDANLVFIVVKGRATIGLVKEDRARSFNIEAGHVIKVEAGTPVYVVNRDEKERLVIAKLIESVAIPGEFEAFYGPGGEDPESFFRAFSWDVLEAALDTKRARLRKVFRKQKQGSIFKISKEQVRSLSQHDEGEGLPIWPFRRESRNPFNLFKIPPSQSNQYGRLFEAGPNEFSHLKDIDLMVSFANLTEGAMFAPFFNTKATKIAWVADGEGEFEMACPHTQSSHKEGNPSEQEKSSPTYHKIRGRLSRGVAFVVPAGHPFVAFASKNNNLQIICFEVNARDNKRIFLAGRHNIFKAMEREAKELAFNFPAKELDEIFSREEEFFFPGPNDQEEEDRIGVAEA